MDLIEVTRAMAPEHVKNMLAEKKMIVNEINNEIPASTAQIKRLTP